MKLACYRWLAFLVCTPALAAPEVVLYNWPYYLAPEVKSLFQRETGIQIKELFYDSDEARNRLLLSEQPPALDVVVVDYLTLQHNTWASLFLQKNEASYSNEKYTDPQYRTACGSRAAPYFWGSVGIAYRTSKVKQPITGWRNLLKPESGLSGHIVMIDDAMDLVSIALKTLGYSINSNDRQELRQAFELLKQQQSHVLAYTLSISAIQDPALSEQTYAVVTYTGDFYSLQAMSKYKDWQYVAPDEGSPLWVDCLAISKKSTHIDDSLRLVNFLMRPDVVRLNSEKMGFAPPTKSSELSGQSKSNSSVFLSTSHLKASEYYRSSRAMDDKVRNAIYFAVLK